MNLPELIWVFCLCPILRWSVLKVRETSLCSVSKQNEKIQQVELKETPQRSENQKIKIQSEVVRKSKWKSTIEGKIRQRHSV